MREVEYGEAAVEVLDILNYTSQEDVKKIPQSFINFLIGIANKDYRVSFNHDVPISGLNLRKQTRELLGFIYITWWCSDKERNKYKNMIHTDSLQTEKFADYDVNDIFKNRKEIVTNEVIEDVNIRETSMIEYKEENLFKRFFNRVLNFFINKN